METLGLTARLFMPLAVVQRPIGAALDRYGPRRVQSALVVGATVGAALLA